MLTAASRKTETRASLSQPITELLTNPLQTMADVKITDLSAYTAPVPATDVLEIVDVANNTSKKITGKTLAYASQKTTLVAGSNVTLTNNDANQTITIASSAADYVSWATDTEQIGFSVNGGVGLLPKPHAISFDVGTRTFQIALANGYTSYGVWVQGTRYVINNTRIVTVPNVSGIYYISYIVFDNAITLIQSTTPYVLESQAPVAIVYWNADNSGSAPYFADERHGVIWSWKEHEYHHLCDGTRWAGGFDISGDFTGNGNLPTDAQIGLTNGIIFDEDLRFNLTGDGAGSLMTGVMYRIGNAWVKDTASIYPYKLNISTAAYNLNTGGVWSLADLGNNSYGVMFVIATNDMNTPFISLMGQDTYSNSTQADVVTWDSLNTTGLPFTEMRVLYKLVFITGSSYANAVRVAQRSYVDYRSVNIK